MTADAFDVLVRGGGASGAAAAALLGRRGRRVALMVGPERVACVPEETVLPESSAMLGRLGLRATVAAAGREGTPRHGVIWGDERLRWRPIGTDGPGWKVPRPDLERDLRERAAAVGVVVLAASGAAPKARREILATGKHGPRSPTLPTRFEDVLPTTVALWTSVRATPEFADATVIEAVPPGWLWWLPLRGGGAAVTLFCDAGEVRTLGKDVLWREALSSAVGPVHGIEAKVRGGVDATPRLRSPEPVVWPIGDAASTVDPLSSQGLEKAFASAADAALCLEAVMTHEGDGEAENELRRRRRAWERRLFRAHAARTLAYYARESRFAGRPFWKLRHAEAAERARPDAVPDDLPLIRSPGVVRSRVWRQAGDVLIPEEGFRRGDDDEAIAQMGGLPVAPLLALFDRPTRTADALLAAAREPRFILATPGAIRQAVAELYARKFVAAEAPVAPVAPVASK